MEDFSPVGQIKLQVNDLQQILAWSYDMPCSGVCALSSVAWPLIFSRSPQWTAALKHTWHMQVMGVHLGIKHLADGSDYTTDSFGDAVTAVRDIDSGWASGGTDTQGLDTLCHESWAALTRYDE